MNALERAERIDIKIYGHPFESAEERVEWVASEILAAEAAANEEATYWRQMWEKTATAALGRFTSAELDKAKAEGFHEGYAAGVKAAMSDEQIKHDRMASYEEGRKVGIQEGLKVRDHDVKLVADLNTKMQQEAFEEAAKIAETRKFYDPEGWLAQAIRARAKDSQARVADAPCCYLGQYGITEHDKDCPTQGSGK